eukprot:7147208-Prymnesium_polylepis.1
MVQLNFTARGAIDNLHLEEQVGVFSLDKTDVLLHVRAVGLNFRDVLNVLGEYPGDPGPPGNDCSGVIEAMGSAAPFEIGQGVIGLGDSPLACLARANANLMTLKPPPLSFEEASTLPVT